MIQIRKSGERGHFNHGWLDTFHTFSFADYHDPEQTGFRSLRVINEDRVAPGQGFPAHSHRDMEIITVVLSGEVEHQDSMGNRTVIVPGEVQCMSAGMGVTHSEYNPSKTKELHLLQIWILPESRSLKPGYEQMMFTPEERLNRLCLVASPQRVSGVKSVKIHQDAFLFVSRLEPGKRLDISIGPDRHVWIQMTAGEVKVNGVVLKSGDGAAISKELGVSLQALAASEFLLFDLP